MAFKSLFIVLLAICVAWLLFPHGYWQGSHVTGFLVQLAHSLVFSVFGVSIRRDSPLPTVTTPDSPTSVFTKDELSKYNGERPGDSIYIAILGRVFDVTSKRQYYGPGKSYSFFAGKDGSRAFVTGDFTEKGLIDELEDLSGDHLSAVDDWKNYYHENYKHVGYLVGKFYKNDGTSTELLAKIENKIQEYKKQQQAATSMNEIYPPCNSEWNPTSGSRVWCTKKSGGVARDWVGVPRMLYQPGDTQPACVCVKISSKSSSEDLKYQPNLKEYSGCESTATSCVVHS